MLNQEKIHRYFNHLSGAKRIEFLYGLLHLCQPLELRYLGTCLEEIARKDYEYLYHAEQKTNHIGSQTVPSTSSTSNDQDENNSSIDMLSEEKLDLTDQLARAYAIVDIALLWAKNRTCAHRLYNRLIASESIKLVDMLLERDDLDERMMDEILVIFCLAANHPAFSFDMRTQISQILKELEKRQRKMKLLRTVQNNEEPDEDATDEPLYPGHPLLSSGSMQNTNSLSVHASPLLTRLSVVNFDTETKPMRILVKADWSDNNSTHAWKTPNDIRSFHLQLSNIVYHDDIRLERLMNISIYLRDIGSPKEPDIDLMKKNIAIYIAHLVYFSSYISTISTLAKFFNSSLKLVDARQRLFNSNNNFEESYSSSSSPSFSNGLTPLQCEYPMQSSYDSENRTISSPKLSTNINKSKQQMDVAKQARSLISIHHGTQTGLEVRCEETQTDRMPGPGLILAEHQDFLRRYTMDQLANLTPSELIADGLDSQTAQLLCGALEDLKPMSVHLNNGSKTIRSPSSVVQIPIVSSSTSPPPLPLLDAALMAVVQQPPRSPPPGFDRNQVDHLIMNYSGMRPPVASSSSPKLPKATTSSSVTSASSNATNVSSTSHCPPAPAPPPLPSTSQHHVPLLAAHPFLYNPVEPCIVPIAIPPGFQLASPDFMRLFAPNMAMAAVPGTSGNANNQSTGMFLNNTNGPQTSVSNSRSASQSNGTNTPPEPNLHHSSLSTTSSTTLPRQSHYRHRHAHPLDPNPFQQNGTSAQQQQHNQSHRSSQLSYSQHHRQKACYSCGDVGHLAFACPEQYLSDSNYSHNTRDGYRLDYRPRQNTPTNHQHQQQQQQHQQQQQRQMRSNSNSKTKVRDNS